MVIMVHRRGEPNAAENQRDAGQHRYHRARQTHEDQDRSKYIERDVRNRSPQPPPPPAVQPGSNSNSALGPVLVRIAKPAPSGYSMPAMSTL
jgi:hypothetical protein